MKDYAVGYTFKAGDWQLNVILHLFHAYNWTSVLIFAILEFLLVQR